VSGFLGAFDKAGEKLKKEFKAVAVIMLRGYFS
jgi:hypothetical protein